MDDIRSWLTDLDLGEHLHVFVSRNIDLQVLTQLTEEDLAEELANLGLPTASRKRIFREIQKLKLQGDSGSSQPASASLAPRFAERRQITVMFCDIVDSTSLTKDLDPEDLGDLYRKYRSCCAAIIDRYEGHVAHYLGDGLVVYFGWPIAHEDDAERGIRSALEIVHQIHDLDLIKPLQVHIGIATGEVVIGENHDVDPLLTQLAIGEAPVLASRVQGVAKASEIVIAESTHRLIGSAFKRLFLGQYQLKGFQGLTNLWRIVGLDLGQGRFESHSGQRLTPFIGRVAESKLVHEHWERALSGTGQVIVVNGEPGIGKSRFLHEVHHHLAPAIKCLLRFQCSPFHTNAPLYPFIVELERVVQIRQSDTNQDKLNKLETFLSSLELQSRSNLSILASLLSLETSKEFPDLQLTPKELKEQTLNTLCDWIFSTQPSLILFEDVHWIDPTSQMLLDLLIDKCSLFPCLLLITHRPEFKPSSSKWDPLLALTLQRMDSIEASDMIERVCNETKLGRDLIQLVVDKTDGIPLFVEEFTQTILQSNLACDRDGNFKLRDNTNKTSIPASLHDSLMARLDQSPKMREVAQIAACIGRSFSHALLEMLSPIRGPELVDTLDQLMSHGLIFASADPLNPSYIFKHALIQDVAYNSLLKRQRKSINRDIADTLLTKFPEIASANPEVIAHYFTEANILNRAATYWLLAAERALSTFANGEAIVHARSGLAALSQLQDSSDHIEIKSKLMMALVAALRMADRFEEALEELNKAEVFASSHSLLSELSRIYHLRGNIYFPMGKVNDCMKQHKAALLTAQKANSVEDQARALGGMGDANYMSGSMLKAHRYFKRCVQLCHDHALTNIEISYRPMLATTHMYCLRFKQALADCHAVYQLVEQYGSMRGEIIARNISSQILLQRKEYDLAEEHALRALSLVEETGTKRFIPLFNDVLARVYFQRGDQDYALKLLQESWLVAETTSPTFSGPWVLGALARLSNDASYSFAMLAQGQQLLTEGCVAHNYFWFYRDAIEVSLRLGDWASATLWTTQLQQYFPPNSMPWADYVVARGQALAELGCHGLSEALARRLQTLVAKGRRLGMHSELVALEAPLQETNQKFLIST